MYLDDAAKRISLESEKICKFNGCGETDHRCQSFAWFDLGPSGWELVDIEQSRFVDRRYDSFVVLPFHGEGEELRELLELLKNVP